MLYLVLKRKGLVEYSKYALVFVPVSPAGWLPADDKGPLFHLNSLMPGPRRETKPREHLQATQSQSHGSKTDEAGFTHLHTWAGSPQHSMARPDCTLASAGTTSTPGCVASPTFSYFRHGPGSKWCHRALSQPREACEVLAGNRQS